MTELIPHAFWFRYAIPINRVGTKRPAKIAKSKATRIPHFGEMDDAPSFATVYAMWNTAGLGFVVEVTGKKSPPLALPHDLQKSDLVGFWIDSRCTQNVHRATRFCTQFTVVPDPSNPVVQNQPIAQSRDTPPPVDEKHTSATVTLITGGYRLNLWLDADAIHGFDPDSNPRLGFYYAVRDSELGKQFLGVDAAFPVEHDPSLWSALELKS